MQSRNHLRSLFRAVISAFNDFFHAFAIERALSPHISWIHCQVGSRSSESRWQLQPGSLNRLSICAVSYKQVDPLLTFLQCLACQSLKNFNVVILHDGYDEQTTQVLADFQATKKIPLEIIFSKYRYNDWGHSLRHIAIDKSETEFIMLTNADNYYVPRMVEYAFAAIDKYSLDLIYWDMIHSHNYPGGRDLKDYSYFKCFPAVRSIDIGSFIVRTTIAKTIGFKHRTYDADGKYFADLLSTGLIRRIGYIDRVLFVHN